MALGIVAGAAAIGNATGTTIGSRLRTRAPLTVIVVVLASSPSRRWPARSFYGIVTVLAVAFAAGLAQSLGKLSLDAIVQRDVPEAVRTSAFARSETLLQLSWVVGGAIGIALPLNGQVGLGIAAAGLRACWSSPCATSAAAVPRSCGLGHTTAAARLVSRSPHRFRDQDGSGRPDPS